MIAGIPSKLNDIRNFTLLGLYLHRTVYNASAMIRLHCLQNITNHTDGFG